jgi:tRNA_anti-like
MSRKSLLLIVMVLAAITAGVYTCREFNRKNVNISKVKPAYVVQASDLIQEFIEDDSSANKKYLGKIVSVKGLIKKIDHDKEGYYTIILGDTAGLSSVLCAMDTTHNMDAANLKTISSVSVRGIFIGFEKDETGLLGSDVKLNRCVLEKRVY